MRPIHLKILLLFVGVFFFQTSLFSNNNFSDKISTLSSDKEWHNILHFRDGESEIDDERFFFAKEGKQNPQAELKASIEKLISDKSDDENSTFCYYPSRSTWILEKLPELKKEIKIPQCIALQKEKKVLGAKYVTLVLASAHINSPASAFGHTFLRIDNNPHTPLLSYAVNYAAQTTETNGFIYAYQGLFGGYKGQYSIEPYYKKLKEYSDLEQRDVWEYKLNLTPEEIERILNHIFEIRHFYADYLFLAENCSYNLLWLIEVAKPNSHLIEQFNHKAIPIDTIRAILSANLVQTTIYRASKRKNILALSRPIENNSVALAFAQSDDYELSSIKNLTKKEKIAALSLATELLKIKRSHNKISNKDYLAHFLRILKERSKLGKRTKAKQIKPSAPQEGHLSTKTSFSYLNNQSISLRTKVAYHDIYDNENGYISGAYINFLDTAIEYKDNKLKLEELNILEIKSYAIQDSIFKPISWEVALGAKRIFNNELNSYVTAGAGITLGSNKLFVYATLTPTLYYRKQTQESIATNIGVLYNPSSHLKFGLLGKNEWFNQNREIKEIEPFFTYSFSQEAALNFNYKYTDRDGVKEKESSLSLFWYF